MVKPTTNIDHGFSYFQKNGSILMKSPLLEKVASCYNQINMMHVVVPVTGILATAVLLKLSPLVVSVVLGKIIMITGTQAKECLKNWIMIGCQKLLKITQGFLQEIMGKIVKDGVDFIKAKALNSLKEEAIKWVKSSTPINSLFENMQSLLGISRQAVKQEIAKSLSHDSGEAALNTVWEEASKIVSISKHTFSDAGMGLDGKLKKSLAWTKSTEQPREEQLFLKGSEQVLNGYNQPLNASLERVVRGFIDKGNQPQVDQKILDRIAMQVAWITINNQYALNAAM
ncbi:MAG: hypothetical protein QRY72_01815 [Candidatus Rhabdochlamydia sp.]